MTNSAPDLGPTAGDAAWPGIAELGSGSDRPVPARVKTALLGGACTLGADRELADRLLRQVPDAARMAGSERRFVRRAMRYLPWAGVEQILNLGCGLLGDGSSVHDLLAYAAPAIRVVHVEADPIVAEHAADLIARTGHQGWAGVVGADIAHPQTVLDHPDTARLLDLGRPVAIIAADVLQYLDDPAAVVGEYRDAVVAGSHLVISHPCGDARPHDMLTMTGLLRQAGIPTRLRDRAEIAGLFDGFSLLPPRLVWAEQWRPSHGDPLDDRGGECILAGVGLKPLATRQARPAPSPSRAARR